MNEPIVSVIMPAFNDESTIGDAMDSIRNQAFTDWELLVVDDGSTDSTSDVVRKIAHVEERVKLVQLSENRGSGVARNHAIKQARGQYIAVMDADDLSLPERLESQAAELSSDPELCVVASQIAEFGTWGGPVTSRWPTTDDEVNKRQLDRKMPLPHPSCMFRASALRAVGGYDERCLRAQDYALFLRLRDAKLRCLSDVHVLYRTSRPIGYRYVRRNARYTHLALQRFELRCGGVPEESLPMYPKFYLKAELAAIKSYAIRGFRERKSEDVR